jgi:protocatechuate 3,4-dioxygenase beta subunit
VDSVTGAPLNKVQVVAEPSDRKLRPASTVTDEKGNFTLVHLPPGSYRLMGSRNGYLQTYYGARRAKGEGIMLTLATGAEPKDLRLKLLPFAVIAGTVRDPEGEPLSGARIALIAVSYRNGIRQFKATGEYASTDDLGQYRIPNVRPGSYYVRAGLEGQGGWGEPEDHSPKDAPAPKILVPAFHPAAAEIAGARRIEVGAGDRVTGADVTLSRSRLFHVRVILEAPPGANWGARLSQRPDFSDAIVVNTPSNCKGKVCEFTAVPNGPYLATASISPSRDVTLDDLFSNSIETRVSAAVDVNNADVDDVHLVLTAPAEIIAHVTAPGDEQADLKNTYVAFVDAEGDDHRGRSTADGSLTALLAPGHYEVEVRAGGDLIPQSIRSEQTDVLQEGLTVSRPGKLPVEIVLAHDAASVEGKVQDKDDQPVSGATVVLIPETKLRSRHDLFQKASTDQFGRYQFKTVTPGAYKLFIWPDVEEGIWFDPDFLKDFEAQGQSVTIDAKGHATADLRLVQ